MAEAEPKKVQAEVPSEPAAPHALPAPAETALAPAPAPARAPALVEPHKDALVEPHKDVADDKLARADDKLAIPPPQEKVDDSKALSVVEKVPDSAGEKNSGGSIDRDAVLTRVETEKRLSLIKAWEENEKSKAENKAQKKLSGIGSWENTRKASVEAKLKTIEEKLEKKKAEYAEKMKNEIAIIHKAAEEKRAMVEAKRGEDLLKAEELSAKYRATGHVPKKFLSCFGG